MGLLLKCGVVDQAVSSKIKIETCSILSNYLHYIEIKDFFLKFIFAGQFDEIINIINHMF